MPSEALKQQILLDLSGRRVTLTDLIAFALLVCYRSRRPLTKGNDMDRVRARLQLWELEPKDVPSAPVTDVIVPDDPSTPPAIMQSVPTGSLAGGRGPETNFAAAAADPPSPVG